MNRHIQDQQMACPFQLSELKGALRPSERGEWHATNEFHHVSWPHVKYCLGQSWSQKDQGRWRFDVAENPVEEYNTPNWWSTDMPEPLRHDSGHEGSHTFITQIYRSIVTDRTLSRYLSGSGNTAPGIVAHASAMKSELKNTLI